MAIYVTHLQILECTDIIDRSQQWLYVFPYIRKVNSAAGIWGESAIHASGCSTSCFHPQFSARVWEDLASSLGWLVWWLRAWKCCLSTPPQTRASTLWRPKYIKSNIHPVSTSPSVVKCVTCSSVVLLIWVQAQVGETNTIQYKHKNKN